ADRGRGSRPARPPAATGAAPAARHAGRPARTTARRGLASPTTPAAGAPPGLARARRRSPARPAHPAAPDPSTAGPPAPTPPARAAADPPAPGPARVGAGLAGAGTETRHCGGPRSPRQADPPAARSASPAALIQDRSSTVFPLPAEADTTVTRAAPSRPNNRG